MSDLEVVRLEACVDGLNYGRYEAGLCYVADRKGAVWVYWSISRRRRYSDGRLTMCGHDCCEHWLQLVHCHYAMGEKGLEQGAVDMGVGLLIRYIAYERRLIARHSSRRSL